MRMTSIILFFFFILNLSVHASELSRVEAIDYPSTVTDDVLVFLSTGKVVKISQNKQDLLDVLQKSQQAKSWLKLEIDRFRYISTVKKISLPDSAQHTQKELQEANAPAYAPSTLKSLEWAKKYFAESKLNPKESQCYNRAHVWSYEWFKKHKFNSSKVFIFFTRKFIREHNFTWWFHIAPLVNVTVNGIVRERVMDMKYTSGPTMLKNWIKRFVKVENPGCLNVSTYSDYANYPENGNCYIMKASMYHYWPLDLENEELHGTIKNSWIDEEIKTAYLEAFDIKK